MDNIVSTYLDLLDAQREAAFTAIEGLRDEQIWERPAPKEWCIGEILDHNYRVFNSFLPFVKIAWKNQQRRAVRRQEKPYSTEPEDPYRKASFPHWVGFLWTPRYNSRHPASLEMLMIENRVLHGDVRAFYINKDPDLLGNITLYDPVIGSLNLIATLRVGIYHDQLHFDDVFKRVEQLNRQSNPLNGKLACN